VALRYEKQDVLRCLAASITTLSMETLKPCDGEVNSDIYDGCRLQAVCGFNQVEMVAEGPEQEPTGCYCNRNHSPVTPGRKYDLT
jgi:hypothetical protein